MRQSIHFNVLYGLTLPLTVSPYERVFMGSIWVSYPFTFSLPVWPCDPHPSPHIHTSGSPSV